MDGYLKQSTASQARLIGPFIDDTDFKSASTGLTIANTDVKLRANGTTLSNKNSGGGTHQVNGMYSLTWDATDTANVGELKYSVKVTGALQVFGSYVVLEEVVYDALFGASAIGYVVDQPVNTTKVGGTTQTARDLGASVLLSSGTGTGQLDFTAGVVKANLAQILASAITGTAAQLSAAFTKWFNVASPTGTVNSLPDAVAGAASGVSIVGSAMTLTNPQGIKKNTALTGFQFPMYTTAGVLATGVTVTEERSIDGGAFAAMTNNSAEIGATGIYTINLAAADTNGDTLLYKMTATGCVTTIIGPIKTRVA